MIRMIWHNDKEDKLGVLYRAIRFFDRCMHFLVVVVLNALGKGLKKHLFVIGGFIRDWTNISKFDLNAKSFLCGKIVELVVYVVCISYVSFQTENSEALKVPWLMNHRVQIVRIVQNTRCASISHFVLALLSLVLIASWSLGGKVWRFKNFRTFEDFGFNSIGLESDIETPLLNFFAFWDHLIKLADRSDTIMGLLEQTLSHSSHSLLVLTNFLRNANEHTKFWWQVNVLSLLLFFKEGLV